MAETIRSEVHETPSGYFRRAQALPGSRERFRSANPDNRLQRGRYRARVDRNVLRLATAAIVMGAVAATAGVAAPDDGSEADDRTEDGTLRGELAVYVADDFQGTTETHYALRTATGDEQPLLFDSQVDLAPGTRIAVQGVPDGHGIRVTSFRRLAAPSATRTSPLISGTPY